MSPIGRGLKFGRYVDSSSGSFDVRGGGQNGANGRICHLDAPAHKAKKETSKENPLVFRDPNGKDWGVSVGQLLLPCRFSVFDIAFCFGAKIGKQLNG